MLTKKLGYSLYKGAWIWKEDPRLEVELEKPECKELLEKGGYLVRNVFDFDCEEQTSVWYVIKESFNGIQDVPSKYRSCIRKALDVFEIKKISKQFLMENGYEIYKKAIENYRVKAIPLEYWDYQTMIRQFDDTYDFWGCIHKESGNLAAYAINHVVGNTVDYQTMKFHPDYLAKLHSSYGLIYEMNRYYLGEMNISFVNDGARSLTNHSEFQPFLMQKFKFRKAYCKLNVVYKPWLRVIVCTLFPFRKWIRINRVSAILNLEAMRRNLL